jgi:type IV pilus assembly protein PilO
MADNALTRLSLNGQIGASVAAAAIVGGLFWYFYYSPAVEERDQKAARLESLQKEIRALEVTANKLQEFQREVQLLEAKLETLKRILPPAKETPDLMRKVQALAAQSNLAIKVFTPMAVVNKDFYQEWPINVAVQGTYHNLALFFDRIGRLSRLVNIGDLKIQSLTTQTGSSTISATCVATTFVYLDTPAAPGAAGAAGAPRPR